MTPSRVIVTAQRPADVFQLVRDAARVVPRKIHRVKRGCPGARRVGLRLAEAGVCPRVVHVAEGCARQPPVTWLAGIKRNRQPNSQVEQLYQSKNNRVVLLFNRTSSEQKHAVCFQRQ